MPQEAKAKKRTFKAALMAYMKATNMSETEIAAEVGVSQAAVNRWLHGHTPDRAWERLARQVLALGD